MYIVPPEFKAKLKMWIIEKLREYKPMKPKELLSPCHTKILLAWTKRRAPRVF
jgi:hypothetical protein